VKIDEAEVRALRTGDAAFVAAGSGAQRAVLAEDPHAGIDFAQRGARVGLDAGFVVGTKEARVTSPAGDFAVGAVAVRNAGVVQISNDLTLG